MVFATFLHSPENLGIDYLCSNGDPLTSISSCSSHLYAFLSSSLISVFLSPFSRVVFPHRKRSTKKGEIIHKKFVMDEGKFYFGPLHSGKSRERYREGRFPENMETLAINNSGCMEAELTFNFKEDTNTSTFLVAPSNMLLQPGETQVRTKASTVLQFVK